jgi:hypothetical protein
MSARLQLVALTTILCSACHATGLGVMPLRDALHRGDQSKVDSESKAVLSCAATPTETDLLDDQPVSTQIVLKIGSDQLGSELVSEAIMCLLRVRAGLPGQGEGLPPACSGQPHCDPCASLMHPLTQSAREALRTYWQGRLELDNAGCEGRASDKKP